MEVSFDMDIERRGVSMRCSVEVDVYKSDYGVHDSPVFLETEIKSVRPYAGKLMTDISDKLDDWTLDVIRDNAIYQYEMCGGK